MKAVTTTPSSSSSSWRNDDVNYKQSLKNAPELNLAKKFHDVYVCE